MANRDLIKKNLKNTLTETNFEGVSSIYKGKVRDMYEKNGNKVFVTTDRQSAFDRVLAAIPFKGAVLNQFSQFWFEQTKDIVANHMIAVPDPNVMVAKPVKIFPVEVVVRGYITGSTGTSAWVNYEKGERLFCGVQLPEGLKKNQKFAEPILTPTTKDDEHDEKISREEIISQGLVPQEKWEKIERFALAVFKRGQEIAAKKGFILVDTKYEFGEDAEGNIILADEVHTPDSSRYWVAATYEQRMAEGKEPENFDKEFLRLWFKDNCDPYNDPELPEAPDDLVEELSARYIDIYEKITGMTFEYNADEPIHERIQNNLNSYFNS
ncbi:phosphoribosylaminoimidazolesuccinocarboxamide synthase [Candidatus Peregrinibacteria bacterium]|nr:MAG: phosphoribosylaminoimidazolesuccinocarboxamide synthase [Candidatus Peregrinibacteria bacterium]